MQSNVVHADFTGKIERERTIKAVAPPPPVVNDGTVCNAVYDVSPDRYQVLGTVGSGGMGTVYKARQIHLDKLVAIKMLSKCGNSDDVRARFQAEAKAGSTFSHPNLVAFRDFGITEHGKPYLVMDYIEGATLADMIANYGPIDFKDAVDIFIQALSGLEHAHGHGVLHRDIKPSNIMLSATDPVDRVKIVDFGIAKAVNATQHLTQTGEVFGTPLYMSPEQGMGKKSDQRSDLYAMGCVMYETLTGQPPFRGESAIETIFMHQTGNIPSLSQASGGIKFPSPLEHVVQKLLEKNPDDRYQTAKEAREALIKIKEGKGDSLQLKVKEHGKALFGGGQKAKAKSGEKTVLGTIESIVIKSMLIICAFLTIISVVAIVSK